jgi:subtilisin-like proprotein convertase family protein
LFEESGTSTEIITIPRANLVGVDSELELTDNGIFTGLTVSVDVTHPEVAFLRVLLISPNGLTYSLHDGTTTSPGGQDLVTTFPIDRAPLDSLDSIIGSPIAGRWVLRLIDTDLDDRGGATRQLNSWTIDYIRQADDAWRLSSNLIVEGAVESEKKCQIKQLTKEDGAPVQGVITLQSGSNPVVALSTFQCGNNQIDDTFDRTDRGRV